MSDAKREILAGALSCFMKNGVEDTTIAQIRDLSGISVGSIYHHFGNKEGIVVALFLTGMKDHADQQEDALSRASGPESGIKSIVYCYIDWIDAHPDWARFVFRYRSLVENSQLAERHDAQRKTHFERLKSWFKPHIDSGAMRKLPFEVYHSLIIGPAQDYALRWLAGKSREKLITYRELYAEAAWQTLKIDGEHG